MVLILSGRIQEVSSFLFKMKKVMTIKKKLLLEKLQVKL